MRWHKVRFLVACTCLLTMSLAIAACETPSSQPSAQSGTSAPRITIQGQSDQMLDLANGEILVGHASSISYARGAYRQDYNAVAYLIVGPGQFKFEVFSGLWDKWTNTSSGIYKQLLDEQYSVPVVRDGHSPSDVQKVCRNVSDSFECP